MNTNISGTFQHLQQVFSSNAFLRKESLGGEIGFFISAYDPAHQVEIEKAVNHLKNRLAGQGIEVLEINLYDLCFTILQEQGRLQQIFEREPAMPKDKLLRALQSSLGVEHRLVPAIEKLLQQKHDIVFLTGVGQVFPFIRSHTILNNLQRVVTNVPLVLFFPGQYNGRSLELFGILHDDNYYRAFNLENIRS